MKVIRVSIRATSPWLREIESDSLFGQICWQISYQFGEEFLESLLKHYEESPFMICSHAFPEGKLPRPMIQFRFSEKNQSRLVEQRKKLSKLRFLPLQSYMDFEEISSEGFGDSLFSQIDADSNKEKKNSETITIGKNAMDRTSGRVLKGILYSQDEIFYSEQGANFSIYFKIDENQFSKENLVMVLKQIGEDGFGKEKSTGKGRFEVTNVLEDPSELKRKENHNAMILLSNSCFSQEFLEKNLVAGSSKLKLPRHGGTLAVQGKVYKNPFHCFEPGSVFRIDEALDYYGVPLKNLTKKETQEFHIQNTFAFPLFCTLQSSEDLS